MPRPPEWVYPLSGTRGSLLDPHVLPGRHTQGVVIVVAHDPRTVGLCDAGVVGREQREVLRGDLLVQRIPRSSLLLQRHLLDGVHLLVRRLVAERRVVRTEGLGL